MVFVRYGGLSSVVQRGFTTKKDTKTYHSPPARNGIYAFPEHWVEFFLLGGSGYGTKNRTVKIKDAKGNVITNRHPDFEKYSGNKYMDRTDGKIWPDAKRDEDGEFSWDDCVHYLVKHVRPRKFTYDGDIWHHLGEHLSKSQLIKHSGYWVLTNMPNFKAAFKSEMKQRRKDVLHMFNSGDPKTKVKDAQFLSLNPYKFHSKDNLEVFIENIN